MQCKAAQSVYIGCACTQTSLVFLQQSKQLLWGCYTLRFTPPDALLEALAKRLTPAMTQMSVRDISTFIWAFGGLNYEPSNMQLLLQVHPELQQAFGLKCIHGPPLTAALPFHICAHNQRLCLAASCPLACFGKLEHQRTSMPELISGV